MADTYSNDILIVDDNVMNLKLLSNMLSCQGYKVRKSVDGKTAVRAAQLQCPDLILLDIMMPDMDGFEVCQQLKESPNTRGVPVIFLSALNDSSDKVRAFKQGGSDYITKPFQVEEVLARVQHQLKIQSMQRALTQLNLELEERVRERTTELEATNFVLNQELKEHQKTQKKLNQLAFYDALTGLPNRALFVNYLKQAINHSQQYHTLFTVLSLDCDRFKLVNDAYGHQVGDQLLSLVAQRLKETLRPTDQIARLGGDEFIVLIENLRDETDACTAAERIMHCLTLPFEVEGRELFVKVSVGIALGTEEPQHPETILRDADTALNRAKASGRDGYQVFDPKMHRSAVEALQLETDLQLALSRAEFSLHYQPIVSLLTGEVTGFEALLRWHHPQLGMISPAKFIPIAEATGLIVPIGRWVLREACHQLRRWQTQNFLPANASMSVNLSVKQFAQANLIEDIDQILADTGLNSRRLSLEITETAVMDNTEAAIQLLQQIKDRHVNLSLDDFGAGHSSLSYLHKLPVNTLKVDRSFINRIDNGEEHLEIVQAIVSLARSLKMTVVAEGIETATQFAQLRDMGCDFGQGYFFAKPLPSDGVVEAFLQDSSAPQS